MASAAFILSIFANTRCNLLKLSTVPTTDPYGTENGYGLSFGLWCFTAPDGSTWEIAGDDLDKKTESARGKSF